MAKTASDLIAQSRILLQDSKTPFRYPTDALISYVNNGLSELKRIRPDVWLEGFNVDLFEYTSSNLDTVIPVDGIFFQPLILFIVGYAELRDDEFTIESRAGLFLQSFAHQLTVPARGVV